MTYVARASVRLDLFYFFCGDDGIVFAYFGLRQLAVVERTVVRVRVAVHRAEVTTAATVKTCKSDPLVAAEAAFSLGLFLRTNSFCSVVQ